MALADILSPRVNELGKIKIGHLGDVRRSQSGGEWRPPVKDDYFTITTMHRESGDPKKNLVPDERLMAQLIGTHGDPIDGKLRRIPIFVLDNDPEMVMQSRWNYYLGKRLAAWSDGKTCYWNIDENMVNWLDTPAEVPWSDSIREWKDNKGNGFKLATVFNCVIASPHGRWGGVYKFRTTGIVSANQLYGSLLQIGKLTNGQLVGLPLQMVVRPMQVAPDGKATTIYVVHCEIVGSDMLAIQSMARESARMRLENAAAITKLDEQYQRLLVAPGQETDPDEVEAIVHEYFPEQTEGYKEEPASSVDPLLANMATPPVTPAALPAPAPVVTPAAPVVATPAATTLPAPADPKNGKTKKGAGGRTDPGNATTGAAIERSRNALGDKVNALLDTLLKQGLFGAIEVISADEIESYQLAAIAALADITAAVSREWLANATLDQLDVAASRAGAIIGNPAHWKKTAEKIAGPVPAAEPAEEKVTGAMPSLSSFTNAPPAAVLPAAATPASVPTRTAEQAAAIIAGTPQTVAPAVTGPAAATAADTPAVSGSLEEACQTVQGFERTFNEISAANELTPEQAKKRWADMKMHNNILGLKVRVRVLDAYANGALGADGRVPA